MSAQMTYVDAKALDITSASVVAAGGALQRSGRDDGF